MWFRYFGVFWFSYSKNVFSGCSGHRSPFSVLFQVCHDALACVRGFERSEHTLKCKRGEWQTSGPICVPRSCAGPLTIKLGIADCKRRKHCLLPQLTAEWRD